LPVRRPILPSFGVVQSFFPENYRYQFSLYYLPPYIDNGNHYQYIEIKFKLQVFYNFFTLQVMSHKLFQIKTRVLFAKLIYQEYGIQYDEVRE